MFAAVLKSFDLTGGRRFIRLRLSHARAALKWALILAPTSAAIGSACALFLWALDLATRARFDHPWLLFGLPLAGLGVGLVYHWKGKAAEGGNNLLVEQIHEPGGGVPLRMAPFLGSTVITHLFGGSAGREGTAVQLGGALANACARLLRLDASEVRILLMAGIAAGFGAVFGTPVAGAVFALEVLTVGRIQYDALIPCLFAALVGAWTCHAWGVLHTVYTIHTRSAGGPYVLDVPLLGKAALAGIAFGLVGLLFSECQHRASDLFRRYIAYAPLRPLVGGILVIALVYGLGKSDYLGLGVWSPDPSAATISGFFQPGRVDHWSWLLKLVFTVVTLSAGFKGGEVTPLFFIGAALGNTLAWMLGAPSDLFAALGFVAVFAAASNTPLACTIMGVEIFGAEHTACLAVACFTAYLCSGHSGIYLSQRLGVPKSGAAHLPVGIALRQARRLSPHGPLIQFNTVPIVTPITSRKRDIMNASHAVTANQTGMIRIYMKPAERSQGSGVRGFFGGRPLYRRIVQEAKTSGIMNAVAHHAHYGYSNHGVIQGSGAEMPNPDLTICVELIGPRETLEAFCRTHGAMLQGKVIIYKHLEHWQIAGQLNAVDITNDAQDDSQIA